MQICCWSVLTVGKNPAARVTLLSIACCVKHSVFVLLDCHAEDALLARMSYTAYIRTMEARLKAASKLTVRQIVKVALICSFIVRLQILYVHEVKVTFTVMLWTRCSPCFTNICHVACDGFSEHSACRLHRIICVGILLYDLLILCCSHTAVHIEHWAAAGC